MTEISSKELVIKAQAGDTEAFDTLLKRNKDFIKKFIYSKNKFLQPADLEDILQKAFVKSWKYLKKFKNNEAQFSTWLNRIAYNCFLDHIKSSKKYKNFSDFSEDSRDDSSVIDPMLIVKETPASILAAQESLSSVNEKIFFIREKLNHNQIKIFDMIFCKGLSYSDTAKQMNCPIGTVMSRVFFTRRKIQKLIKKYEKESPSPR
jgi:RNA polymerase sigma-70 factor (ECF subfamily)